MTLITLEEEAHNRSEVIIEEKKELVEANEGTYFMHRALDFCLGTGVPRLCWLWYVVVVVVVVGLISIFMNPMRMRLNYKMASTSSNTSSNKIKLATARSLRSMEMVNKIRRVPLRTEGLFCSISSEVAMMVSAVSRAARASLCREQVASTPNQVLNRSCMVAIPMQNKKEILNN